jgi:thioredoxin 1
VWAVAGDPAAGCEGAAVGIQAGVLTLLVAISRYVTEPQAPAAPFTHTRCPMGVGKVSDATFETEVLKASEPVVVDFWAEWCGPCRMIAPALEEIAGTMGSKVKVVKLNVDENPATASKYEIMSIPTLMIFKNGQLASRQVGAAPKQKLEQWISAAM